MPLGQRRRRKKVHIILWGAHEGLAGRVGFPLPFPFETVSGKRDRRPRFRLPARAGPVESPASILTGYMYPLHTRLRGTRTSDTATAGQC